VKKWHGSPDGWLDYRYLLLSRKRLPDENVELVSQLLASLAEENQVVLQCLGLVHVPRDLSAGSIRDRTKAIDPALRLPGAVVETDDQFLKCRSVPAQHAERLLQSKCVEEGHGQEPGQQDLKKPLHVVHARSNLRIDAR